MDTFCELLSKGNLEQDKILVVSLRKISNRNSNRTND